MDLCHKPYSLPHLEATVSGRTQDTQPSSVECLFKLALLYTLQLYSSPLLKYI